METTMNKGRQAANGFRDFFSEIEPIRLREPLAETLGAFKEGDILEYTFADVVKMAGHGCPTMAGAFLICQEALKKLYPGEIPVRGEISITVYGDRDEGVFGVISHAFMLITGAASSTGFKGLGYKFKRKDLLAFSDRKIDPEALCFEFRRMDTDRSVVAKFFPRRVPFPAEKASRMGELMEKVIWEAAKDNERREFQDLWSEKVKTMVLDRKGIENWLIIEERSN